MDNTATFKIFWMTDHPDPQDELSLALQAFPVKYVPYDDLFYEDNFILSQVACVLISWHQVKTQHILKAIRARNLHIPILLIADHKEVSDVSYEMSREIQGVIWRYEDTPHIVVGRIEHFMKLYREYNTPPFFGALKQFSEQYTYAWHTPGHSGGSAFLKSPAGRLFYEFFGESIFRSDFSVSVRELGSLLEHTGPIRAAEENSAEVFGAEKTYYVTNGTSTANKIVWHACVTPSDFVLIDRNCHKSVLHALIMTRATPVYFRPERNAYGMIGTISVKEFQGTLVAAQKIFSGQVAKIATITHSTYDGLCYHIPTVKKLLSEHVANIHFDEAWLAYARFHPFYHEFYAMTDAGEKCTQPVFATQSTHKLLAAFSQAAMIHCQSGSAQSIVYDYFNEAYMMHTSTSPQYALIASLDVATKMMEGRAGFSLIDETLEEALIFRKKIAELSVQLERQATWWFSAWQPKEILKDQQRISLFQATHHELKQTHHWVLKSEDLWHGFKALGDLPVLLDPTKVTLLTPGLAITGQYDTVGIPAMLVAEYLDQQGIVVEKVGFYSFLILFSIGTTKGKASTLLAELSEFKSAYDHNLPVHEVFPELHALTYAHLGLKELAQKMHEVFKAQDIAALIQAVDDVLPTQAMLPAETYAHLVNHQVKNYPISELLGKTCAVMLVPYPPGIPLIMPGEMFSEVNQPILDLLMFYENFSAEFPGFETEVHGVTVQEINGQKRWCVPCVM